MAGIVRDNPEAHRFEMPIGDDVLAAAYYREDGDTLVLIHTEVPSEFAGSGFATQLADGVFDLARRTGRKILPTCEFMRRYATTHPATRDVVV